MKGLTRVDHDGKKMYGWLVRAYGGGQTFSKYFSDRRYGGKVQSRKMAVMHLKKMSMEINERFADYVPRQNQPLYRKKPGRTNKTGVVGIHRCETVNHGKSVTYWAATWNEDGKPKDKKFYFGNGTRDEEEAKKLAIEWRARKIIELSPIKIQPVYQWINSDFKKTKPSHQKSSSLLKGWVPGLVIKEWSPNLGLNGITDRKVKKREKLGEKRVRELATFMGIAAVLFDWKDIDYDFGRGVFKGDIRSRCFWNKQGCRTDVLVDDTGRIVIYQNPEPDPYYVTEKLGRQMATAEN